MKTVFIDKKKRRNVYVQKKKKDEKCIYKVFWLFTNIYKMSTRPQCFIVPPRSPHSPMLPSSGCDGNTGRSPASKNPNGSSGTCTAGDRPVSQTGSSRGASGTHRDTRSNWPVSMVKTGAPTFAA